MFDFSNPQFWVTSAFILLVILAYKKVTKAIAVFLDSHSAKIKAELDAASILRKEAEETLALYKQKQAEFTKEAENILAKARDDAEANSIRAQEELKISLDVRLKQAMDKIAQEEAAAIADVRNRIIDITLAAARSVIIEQMAVISQEEFVKLAMADVERKIH